MLAVKEKTYVDQGTIQSFIKVCSTWFHKRLISEWKREAVWRAVCRTNPRASERALTPSSNSPKS